MGRATFEVHGRPRPQGSGKPRPNGTFEYSVTTLRWRSDVTETVLRLLARGEPFKALSVPVVAVAEFRLDCTERRKITDPPDTDKLQRAIGDALKDAGVLADDSVVVGWHAWKRATLPGETEGVTIRLEW